MVSTRDKVLAAVYRKLDVTEFVVLSKGGQGSSLALKILGMAFALEDKYFTSTLNVRGWIRLGPTIQYCRVSSQPDLLNGPASHPTHALLFDEAPLYSQDAPTADALVALRSGLLVINSSKPADALRHPYKFDGEVLTVNATDIALRTVDMRPPPVGLPLIAAWAGATKIVGLEALQQAVAEYFSVGLHSLDKSRLVRGNLEAARLGYEVGGTANLVRSKGLNQQPNVWRHEGMEGIPIHGDVHRDMVEIPGYSTGRNPFIFRESVPVWKDEACTRCAYCFSMVFCPDWCWNFTLRPGDTEKPYDLSIDLEHCKGCYVCAEVCPFGAVEMQRETSVAASTP